jgi:hypothetical protein
MKRGVALYLVGSAALLALVGCGRSWLEEREPWRREAELACIKSGAIKPGPAITQVKPIDGPGVCGAEYPFKVTALGEGSPAMGYSSEPRPPAGIPQAFRNMPASAPPAYEPAYPASNYPPPRRTYAPQSYPARNADPTENVWPHRDGEAPLSLHPPGTDPQEDEEPETADVDPYAVPGARPLSRQPYGNAQPRAYPQAPQAPYSAPVAAPLPRLGPQREPVLTLPSAATVAPAATLACPMVSALDQWMTQSVQPAAQRWFGQQVVEIKQISAYSCRGMNGQRGAPISEHAFGNALDISAFTLADGRRITVKGGWRGEPEEQGFLRDVQAAACDQFSTVLAPGSNVYHYDHIHVDLRRRRAGRGICKPVAVSGEQVAQRAREQRYSGRGSGRLGFAPADKVELDFEIKLPRAIPGAD